MLGGALSAVIRYHHVENRPKAGICVANHTSPIDVLVLACDNAYALVSIALVAKQSDGVEESYTSGVLNPKSLIVFFFHSTFTFTNHTSPIDVLLLACENAYFVCGYFTYASVSPSPKRFFKE